MSGLNIHIDISEITTHLLPRLARLADLDKNALLDNLGGLGVSQTQRRITSEKTSPDGEPWKPNRRGGSILFLEGHLNSSIAHEVGRDDVSWGSNLVYAAIHQTGGTITAKNGKSLHFQIGNQHFFPKSVTLPARPFLGLSDDNKTEVVDALNDWIGTQLQ
jgi:phage gpG-like protein